MTADKPLRLVPKLRFPEFRSAGDWHFQPLSDIAEPISDRVGTSKCVPMSVTTGIGLITQKEKFGRIIAGNSYKSYLRLQTNDFAYNKSATKEFQQGYIARYSGTRDAAVPKSIFTCFRPDAAAVIPEYLDHLLHGNHHGRWLRKYITVGARAHGALSVSVDALMSMPVPLPPGAISRSEQHKIADCLDSLDDLIAAERRKLKTLQQYKQGLMQEIFPRSGEKLPSMRFPEFHCASEWNTRKLEELVLFQSGGTPSKGTSEYWNGSIPWVSAKDMKRLFLEDTEDHISIAAIDNGARLVPAGTLLVLTRGMTLRKNVPVCVLRTEMSFNQDVKALLPKAGVNGLFLAFSLLANKQRLLNLVDIAGHGTGRLSTYELEAFELTLPQPAEQERIALCLSSLDEVQSAQSRKIESLTAHKQGLLQQLFPSLETE